MLTILGPLHEGRRFLGIDILSNGRNILIGCDKNHISVPEFQP
jgi:hypothetical protein